MRRITGALVLGLAAACGSTAYLACVLGDVSEVGKPCACTNALGYWCSNPFQPDAGVCQSLECSAPGQANCGGVACTDLSADPANCGACGNACPAQPDGIVTCVDGGCAARCDPLYKYAGGSCVAFTDVYDDAGCAGISGETCAPGLVCIQTDVVNGHPIQWELPGRCHCQTGSSCGNLGSCYVDAGLCRCGTLCTYGEVCDQNGQCSCNGGKPCGDLNHACCNAGCADLTSDPRNCGACGFRCPDGFGCMPPPDAGKIPMKGVNNCVCTGSTTCQEPNVPDGAAFCDVDAGRCTCFGTTCDNGQVCTNAGCR